jgi:flagellar motor switch protein FliN
MSEASEKSSPAIAGLIETWLEKLTGVIEMMTETKPSASWSADSVPQPEEGALLIEQRFKSAAEPMIWIGLPESVHQGLGSKVLLAAGVDVSDAEENRATALEIVEQSLGGFVAAFVERTGQECERAPIKECLALPSQYPTISVTLSFGEISFAPLSVILNPSLISLWEVKPAEPASLPVTPAAPPHPSLERYGSSSSRTFELLLDVALPVSVSFGRTELAVKDVLKLTTGSIVELNRSISEPVEIIVNNCIIARGEVVVVEGNYGVRINNIVSRKERLQTGGAALTGIRTGGEARSV